VISLLQEKVPNAQIIFDPQTLSIDDLSKLATSGELYALLKNE
jgi:hypothetical protein